MPLTLSFGNLFLAIIRLFEEITISTKNLPPPLNKIVYYHKPSPYDPGDFDLGHMCMTYFQFSFK